MALIGKVQRGQLITADMMNNIIDSIRECQLQSVVGGVFKRGVGGTTITLDSRQAQASTVSNICPFQPIATATSTGYNITFQAGTINGVFPENMLSAITGVTTGSNNYFYLKCTTDGKVITSSVLEKDTTLRTPVQPTADTAPTEFNVMIGYMTTAGITERTISCGHLQARIAPSLQQDATVYVAGKRNYTQFYNWVF